MTRIQSHFFSARNQQSQLIVSCLVSLFGILRRSSVSAISSNPEWGAAAHATPPRDPRAAQFHKPSCTFGAHRSTSEPLVHLHDSSWIFGIHSASSESIEFHRVSSESAMRLWKSIPQEHVKHLQTLSCISGICRSCPEPIEHLRNPSSSSKFVMHLREEIRVTHRDPRETLGGRILYVTWRPLMKTLAVLKSLDLAIDFLFVRPISSKRDHVVSEQLTSDSCSYWITYELREETVDCSVAGLTCRVT